MNEIEALVKSFIETNGLERITVYSTDDTVSVNSGNGENIKIKLTDIRTKGSYELKVICNLHNRSEFGLLTLNLQTFLYMTGKIKVMTTIIDTSPMAPTHLFS